MISQDQGQDLEVRDGEEARPWSIGLPQGCWLYPEVPYLQEMWSKLDSLDLVKGEPSKHDVLHVIVD